MRVFYLSIAIALLFPLTSYNQSTAKTANPQEFITKLAKYKYPAQLRKLERITDEELLGEICKSTIVPVGVSMAAAERLTDPEIISDVARSAPALEVQQIAIEKTSDQAVFIAILMEPETKTLKAYNEAARKLNEASAIEVATKAPNWFNRSRAVSQLNDQKILAEIAVKEAGNYVSVAAIERLTNQELLTDLATNGETPSMKIAAIKKVSDQTLLEEIVLGSGGFSERKTALSRVTDQEVLEKIALSDSTEKTLRQDATRRIENTTLLAKIAKNETDLDMLEAALRNIREEAVLLDIARTARYKLTRKLMIARLDFHWRREVGLGAVKFNIGNEETEVKATITNLSQDFAYEKLGYTLDFMSGIDADKSPDLFGKIEPGRTETLWAWLSGNWRSSLNDQTVFILRKANPVLPNDAVDLTILGEAPTKASVNHAPSIADQAIWKHTTRTNAFFGDIEGVTTEIFIDAEDPDGDALTYEWKVSNGTIKVNRPIATWERVIEGGKIKEGFITVTVDDGRGGFTAKSFVSDMK